MIVRSIHVVRDGDFGYGRCDPSKPFRVTVATEGDHGKVELLLPADISEAMVALIAEQIAAAGRATAEAMTAQVLTQAALPQPEAAF